MVALAAVAASAACGSASSSAAPAAMTPVVIGGSTTVTGGASMTVKATGAFADTGVVKLPLGDPRTFTFKFDRGNLVVLNATGPVSGPVHLDKATCAYSQSLNGTFRVLASSSTGSYAGTTGHGSYAFTSDGTAARTAAGQCVMPSSTTPAKSLSVQLRGPVILNEP